MIVNLSLNPATKEQKEAGLVDLKGKSLKKLKDFLTFEFIPTEKEIEERVELVVELAKKQGAESALIQGPPWVIPFLYQRLRDSGIKPLFAFYKLERVEEVYEDRTISEFEIPKFTGFIG